MAKSIITDENIDDNDNFLGYELIGVTGAEKNSQAIILGRFDDEKSAKEAMFGLICWLKSEAFSTFDVPTEDGEM